MTVLWFTQEIAFDTRGCYASGNRLVVTMSETGLYRTR